MKITWDDRKRLRNIETHRLDFADVAKFDWANAIIRPSHSQRFKAIGAIGDQLVAVVFAYRGTEGIAVISLRPASTKERRLYGAR